MLIVDGVKYRLWTPKYEEEQFHPIVEEHSKEIFGKNSLYFPKEKRLVSKSGRGVMPDGFAVVFSKEPEIYVVEVELSFHDLDAHIVEQLNRFRRALKNPENRKEIADMLHREIKNDLMKEAFVKERIGTREIYKFLSDLVSQHLKTVIIIERKDDMVVEACEGLSPSPMILEFKTFVREDAENVHAHLFEPLHKEEIEKAQYDEGKKKETEEKYTEAYHLKDTKAYVTSVYDRIRQTMLRLDPNIKINPQKYYISLRKKRNFAFILKPQKKAVQIIIMLPYESGNSLIKKHKLRQLSQGVQKFYNGQCFLVTIENEENLEEIIKALEEAYRQQN